MQMPIATLIALSLTAATLMMAGCGSGTGAAGVDQTTNATPAGSTTGTIDGAALYAAGCASCHGTLAASSKTGTSAALIQTGISSNIGGMGALSALTADQVQAIATALGAPPAPVGSTSTPVSTPATTPTGTPTTTPVTGSTGTIDGAALYAADCAGCHGPLASSSKSGATAARIQAGIAGVGGMNYLGTLSAAEVQAIAAALVPTAPAPTPAPAPAPLDGAALYASYCASCHGSLATSNKRRTTASRIQAGITGVRSMNSLSFLTTEQIQAIATALNF